ncbi:uncharacterized protein LOC118425315 [Branchiostoma floridae]|uniref:Uncharacterized protein LOC118425315 n=1 Tax=Branchiostoma floridae TaxID=7739 RepID=A0A9J7LXC5_BRAFL|nr:uncharacterized protein LOC118425315 [Branchiostoma floridae]
MTAEENLDRLQQVVLFDRAGTEIIASPLQSRAGISGTKYSATILLSSQSFRIGVKGTDRNNFTLQRIDMAWIQPQYFSVETLPGTQGQLFPGGQLTVPVLIMNHGNLNVFRLNVSDDAGLVRGVEPAVVSLPFGENTTVLVTFAAPANSSIGSTSITTLLVSGDDGSFNSIVLRVSVEARSTDVPDFVPPSCIIQDISKNCSLEQQHLSICGNYNWSTPGAIVNNDASDIASIVVGSVLGSVVLILIILHAVVSFSVSWYRRRGQKKVAHAQYRVNEVDISQID